MSGHCTDRSPDGADFSPITPDESAGLPLTVLVAAHDEDVEGHELGLIGTVDYERRGLLVTFRVSSDVVFYDDIDDQFPGVIRRMASVPASHVTGVFRE